ncbi:MAG TPA: arylesterase [Cyclobacteriaceae bacterium]|nr:arylesterase [Cyclobacteriaceae bacterium]
MQNILFFGDSLTAGYGLSDAERESFPALIQKKIDGASLPFQIINAGVSGDTTASGLARLDYWLNRTIHVLVLELGINDIIRGVPLQTTSHNLQLIVDRVKEKYPNVRMALMGMEIPEFIPGVPASFSEAFRAVFRKLAESNNMIFVPFFLEGVAGKRDLNLGDGLHPSAAGYRIIANKVWPAIRSLLEEDIPEFSSEEESLVSD